MTDRLVVRSGRVWIPTDANAAGANTADRNTIDGRPADITIRRGVITSIDPWGSQTAPDPDGRVRDFGDLCVLPGLVDPHVHLNEPGRADWEGFETGTAAARAGGLTTLVDMPLNSSPVTTSIAALQAKRQSTAGKLSVDVAFHAGLVPENAGSIETLIQAGCVAAKAFLCPSGIDEFPHCDEATLRTAMPRLAAAGVPLLVHAEIASEMPPMPNPHRYSDYLATRPRRFERAAIEMMIRLARETDCHVHIVHLADADSIATLAQARKAGVPITVETCHHYLYFDAESIPDRRTDFKCAPPIREAENRERLWRGLADGTIDMITSDHSPCTTDLKGLAEGRFDTAWGGISSLQLGLSVVWTAARSRGFTLSDVVRWMSIETAKLVRVPGGIHVGNPAHLVVFDPDAAWTVDQHKLLHRNPITPYHGHQLTGKVITTFVGGNASDALDPKANGRIVRRAP